MKRSHIIGIVALIAGATLAVFSIRTYQRRVADREAYEAEQARMALPDTLRVVTLSGSTIYFQYRGEEMGYQYELLRSFSEHSGIPFVLQTAPDLDSIHRMIASGSSHLSITPEPVSQSGKQLYRYTGPETESSMVLVQRAHRYVADSVYVADVTGLLGKQVYTIAGSHYARRLANLEQQLGGKIHTIELQGDTIDIEDLIARVASDSIDYTVVDLDLARLARTYYSNIDLDLEIGFAQRLRWITSSRYEGLARAIDSWTEQAPVMEKAKTIYRKYFEINKVLVDATSASSTHGRRVYQTKDGAISPYDGLFRQHASRLSWSWHLLASIAYQESNFHADIVGWSGARGLMGIMPRTGASFGASREQLLDPEVSVRVSVDCLLATERSFASIQDPIQRMKLTLAGYNAGVAHIQDAQRLAKKYGADSNVWDDNVERYILLKSERKYYTDPVCKYGYLRGRETHRYVREVMDRYEQYRQIAP